MKKTIWGILLGLWIAFIFINSMQTKEQSQEASGWVIHFIAVVLKPFGVLLSSEELSLFVRKGAHMFEFFVLMLLFSQNYSLRIPIKKALERGLLSCILIAMIDELIQLFVSGRSGSIIDVAIDNVGAVFGLLVCLLIFRMKQKKAKTTLNKQDVM
jgi:VanZ family protein